MRSARYRLTGVSGGEVVEQLSLRRDDRGDRYDAVRSEAATGAELGRLQLQVDAGGVTTRLHVEGGGWVLRGGCVGDAVLWRRGEHEGEAPATGFWGTSPAYALAVLHRLGLAVGESRRVRLVEVTEPVLATRLVTHSWSRTAQDGWRVDDLDTGERRALLVVDGLVASAPGLTFTRL